jgi:hypothetical protein
MSVARTRLTRPISAGIAALIGLVVSAAVLVPSGTADAATVCYPPGTICHQIILVTLPKPKVVGAAKAKATLKVTPKAVVSLTYGGKATVKYTYQWLKNGVAIKGAKAATYKIPANTRKGTKFSVKITATATTTASGSVSGATKVVNVTTAVVVVK